jgi:hypothetical protein
MSQNISRRGFMSGAAAMGALAAMSGLAGCAQPSKRSADSASSASDSTSQNWLGSEPTISDDSISDTKTADVVVVGAGTGGLFAACAAAESNASVIVLEKGDAPGAVKDDLGAVNSALQKEDGTVIDKDAMSLDMYRYSNGHMNLSLFNRWYESSAETIDWYTNLLKTKNVTMWHEAAIGDVEGSMPHWATGHSPAWPEDNSLSGGKVLSEYATQHNAQILYSTPMVKLVTENGKVTGVIAKDENGAYIKCSASKGVVIACGGYASNKDMIKALQPDVDKMRSSTWAPTSNSGDGIKACLWAGAAMDPVHSAMFFDRCAVAPTDVSGVDTKGSQFWMGSQPWLKVNLNGERFTNEGTGVYDWILHAALNQPNNTYCSVFDSNWKTYAQQFVMHGCSRLYPFENGAPSNHDIPFAEQQLNTLIDKGIAVKADTIAELAGALNIPADTFTATVSRYNDCYAQGKDADFGKESYRLSKLDTPPYYGVRQAGSLLCTLDGIRINEKCQALKEDGTVIEGLYVTGNDSGCYFDTSYPNQATGLACGRTVTFGRQIGKELAQA